MSQDILLYQNMVDEAVRKLGGYWRPLSGLARLMEELGELNEVLLEEQIDKEELSKELADLFIITASIANQYCVDLNEEFHLLGYPEKVEKLYHYHDQGDKEKGLMKLSLLGGQIARILNHYEGDKKKKPTEKNQRLAREIASFQVELIAFSRQYDISLFFYVQKVLNHDMERDKHRFSITHDPTTEPSLSHFIQANRNSDYLKLKKLWGSYEWNEEIDIERNLKNSLESLNRFVKVCEWEGLEGFVLEVVGSRYIKTEQERNETIRKVLSFYNRFDTENKDFEDSLIYTGLDFIFTYRGQKFEWVPFVNEQSLFILFLPIY